MTQDMFQFPTVSGCFQQAMGDGVQFVVLLQFQRIEVTLSVHWRERRIGIANIDQLLQLPRQLLKQPVLRQHGPVLGDGLLKPLLNLSW